VDIRIRRYEKIGRYPHNGYPKDMDTGTRRIFIQQVGYRLTSLNTTMKSYMKNIKFENKNIILIYILG